MAEIGKKTLTKFIPKQEKKILSLGYQLSCFDRRWIRFCPLPFVFLFLFFTLYVRRETERGQSQLNWEKLLCFFTLSWMLNRHLARFAGKNEAVKPTSITTTKLQVQHIRTHPGHEWRGWQRRACRSTESSCKTSTTTKLRATRATCYGGGLGLRQTKLIW